ncbi:hypothetical protein POM88_038125 [Heracleum sosnowskyi]|uniref:DUF4378 domain-containing protein n=1 Tax=Heracleum sosnowskyi TaxID=360622 RepID=A0AAD8MHD9_9APIA|nr:hypothetical protein POM88_038125 [Heracleum sosnowskyi]
MEIYRYIQRAEELYRVNQHVLVEVYLGRAEGPTIVAKGAVELLLQVTVHRIVVLGHRALIIEGTTSGISKDVGAPNTLERLVELVCDIIFIRLLFSNSVRLRAIASASSLLGIPTYLSSFKFLWTHQVKFSNEASPSHSFSVESGLVHTKAESSATKPCPSRNPFENQEQPRLFSVLETPFQEEDHMELEFSDNFSLHQMGLIYLRILTLLSAADLGNELQSDTFLARFFSLESPLDPLLRDTYLGLKDKEILHEAKRMQNLVFDCVNAALGELAVYESDQWKSRPCDRVHDQRLIFDHEVHFLGSDTLPPIGLGLEMLCSLDCSSSGPELYSIVIKEVWFSFISHAITASASSISYVAWHHYGIGILNLSSMSGSSYCALEDLIALSNNTASLNELMIFAGSSGPTISIRYRTKSTFPSKKQRLIARQWSLNLYCLYTTSIKCLSLLHAASVPTKDSSASVIHLKLLCSKLSKNFNETIDDDKLKEFDVRAGFGYQQELVPGMRAGPTGSGEAKACRLVEGVEQVMHNKLSNLFTCACYV